MSVINQMLNQLEQRGTPAAPEQVMVRAVPHGRRRRAMPLLALGLALAGGVAAWQWMQMRKPVLVPAEGPEIVAASTLQAQSVAASSVPVAAVQDAQAQASGVPASAAMPAAASAVAGMDETAPVEIPPPASRLSFELNMIPLPSSLRQTGIPHDAKNGASTRDGEKQAANAAPSSRPAKPQPGVQPNTRVVAQPPAISPLKQVSPAQHADAEFRKAVALMQQGHVAAAIAGYEAVLRLDAGHNAARQALVALLLENKREADAERALEEGLRSKPEQTGFAMLLARLQVEQGALGQAVATLEKSLPHADAQADYQAFFAALLQRQNRHKEAIDHYQIALQLAPENGVWLMGYGISLQAVQRIEDAREAFRRALESKTLSPELQAFVRQKIKEL